MLKSVENASPPSSAPSSSPPVSDDDAPPSPPPLPKKILPRRRRQPPTMAGLGAMLTSDTQQGDDDVDNKGNTHLSECHSEEYFVVVSGEEGVPPTSGADPGQEHKTDDDDDDARGEQLRTELQHPSAASDETVTDVANNDIYHNNNTVDDLSGYHSEEYFVAVSADGMPPTQPLSHPQETADDARGIVSDGHTEERGKAKHPKDSPPHDEDDAEMKPDADAMVEGEVDAGEQHNADGP
eukprot:PhM_4_TR8145/c0_g1_i1/m.99508